VQSLVLDQNIFLSKHLFDISYSKNFGLTQNFV